MTDTVSVPTISTRRLLLRPARASDAGPMAHYAADPRLARMTTSIPHPYPPGAAEAYLESLSSGRLPEDLWVIDASPIDWSEMVGVIVYRPAKSEIGYWIGAPFWGTGFASEAVEALVEHLFRTRSIEHIIADAMAENEASLKVLERAGFRRVGEKQIYSVARGEAVPGVALVRERG